MKIVLHVGPHKTGTTSLQYYLRQRYGHELSRECAAVWYPLPVVGGPGHSALAKDLLAHEGQQLRKLIDTAKGRRVGKLILSSEDFAYAHRGSLPKLRRVFAGENLTLIVTLNSPIRRAA